MFIAKRCRVLVIFTMLVFVTVPASAQSRGWEKKWNKILHEARREGKVVLRASSDPVLRRELPAEFKRRFGIDVEYLVGRSSQIAAKLRVERRVGISTVDVFLGGINTIIGVLYPKMIDPLRRSLILPDVLEPSNWKRGKLWFLDPEGKYALRLKNVILSLLEINTRYVKRKDLKSVRDLLHPRWKGKMALMDPTVPGTGNRLATAFYVLLGEEFVRKLYVDQRPIMTRNRRQLADWLARGIYPLVGGVPDRAIARLQDEGFPVASIHSLPDFGGMVGAGSGIMTLMNKAPHPNAARVLVNWLASKEGLEFFSRINPNNQTPTTRSDVDESSIPAERIPRPGVAYFDISDWDLASKTNNLRLRMQKILKQK